MEISIVSGTYNRLESLQRMVASVRQSVCDFQQYEIVLVDGGSTDGTIEWCKQQPDVRLIEQGRLLGAVKAFNAGAQSACGRYTILANDDITFVGDSIIRSYRYMEDNPVCGMGCFYQDRDGLAWHVSRMRATTKSDGRTVSVYYGQVAIVPTVLGNALGWWGDYLHTYGGDNELSCQIWQAGYTVDAIDCACISDGQLHDELRRINAGSVELQSGQHPDTRKWSERWPNGPTIPVIHIKRNEVRRMRIMYFPLYEPGNRLQKRTKVGMRQALEKIGSVLQFDYMAMSLEECFTQADAFQPDMFLFQLQDARSGFSADIISELRRQHPDTVFVNWNGDYHPENLFDASYMDMMAEFDLVGVVTTQVGVAYDTRGINWWYWQIGYEDSTAEPDDNTPAHDVVFLGNGYSAQRLQFGAFLHSLRQKGWDVGLYGSWPNELEPAGDTLYDFDAGRQLYRASRFAISTQMYPAGHGFVSNRLFQALAAGNCMVLQQRFDGMEELLGLLPGKHLDVWETFAELEQKLHYWTDRPTGRQIVSSAGTAYTLRNFSFDAQVKKMLNKLRTQGFM